MKPNSTVDTATIKEVLAAARAKVEKSWTQRTYARDEFGHETSYTYPEACSFCTLGAIKSALDERGIAPSGRFGPFPDAVWHFAVTNALPEWSIVEWNDHLHRTQEQVLAAFDKAIAALDPLVIGPEITATDVLARREANSKKVVA